MGFWGAVVGGVIGGLVGGPVGAAIGAGAGVFVGGGDEEEVPHQAGGYIGPEELPMELRWYEHSDGLYLEVHPGFGTRDVALFSIQVLDDGSGVACSGFAPYANDEGEFLVLVDASADGSPPTVFLPRGAAITYPGRTYTMRVVTHSEDDAQVLGLSTFECPPIHGEFSRVHMMRPIVNLAMRVARADGRLDRSEVAALRDTLAEEFELDSQELERLRELMKAPLEHALQDDINTVFQRFPQMDYSAILVLLAEVAHADGRVEESEIAMIRDIAQRLGATDEEWAFFAEQAELVSSESEVVAALRVLGLGPDATITEIRATYRAKMRDYHPDRVANLAAEFQELAHRKSQELNEAWSLLSRHFD